MCNKQLFCLLSVAALSFSGLVVGQPPTDVSSSVSGGSSPAPRMEMPPPPPSVVSVPPSPGSLGFGQGPGTTGGIPNSGTIPSGVVPLASPATTMRAQTAKVTSLVSDAVKTMTERTNSADKQNGAVIILGAALADPRFGELASFDQQRIIAALKQAPQAVLQAAVKDILKNIAQANMNAQKAGNVPLQQQLRGLQKQFQPQLQKGQKGQQKPAGKNEWKGYKGDVYKNGAYVDEAGKRHELYKDYTGGQY